MNVFNGTNDDIIDIELLMNEVFSIIAYLQSIEPHLQYWISLIILTAFRVITTILGQFIQFA